MLAYIIRRLLLILPTLLGALLVTFTIVQFAPGGPVDQVIARLQGEAVNPAQSFSANQDDVFSKAQTGDDNKIYQGAYGLDPEYIKELEKQFGFDKPVHERFFLLVWDYLRFDFGESYFRNTSVVDLVIEKLPVSISLGLWMTLLSYGISIPLGIRKAVQDGSRFDIISSSIIIIAYAIPGFVLAVFLIILFAGGSFFTIFPLGGLVSENFDQLPWYRQIIDYFWHLTLPIIVMATSAFAVTTFLTKNSFVDEISKKYVMTARAKGLQEKQILYRHVFRNAMLIVISGFPSAFIGAFFTGSLLIEKTFSLDGLGLLGFEAIVSRDYAIVFALLYIFGLLGLIINLISDITYVIIDPRIDFETREK